ncbi:hypothetical protein phytr_8700 [Candidatus Phycorickettsia trachydisci]|uniref:HIT domain-containing protein n=1 Tax=Candidatus Phycorickettsia trachydisci TaxID=2115978 RepID=A0A2P1P962_9RICK|nr:HIT family protein [Candidatus Phycorickettsia trachydisci]AVP87801.1 hypothetical protein phytr_8700 [Candidatus Phycorickettsia trachydisci]
MKHCIFCGIVAQTQKSHIIWESENHIAFLSIFPNMKGVTVVIPKKHFSSYAFSLNDEELTQLVLAAKHVAVNILDKKLKGVGRTGLVLEGFGVDHVHAKLFPLPNTASYAKNWQQIQSNVDHYFHEYPGYICTNDGPKADDQELAKLAKRLSNNNY